MTNSHHAFAPATKNRTVTPRRSKNTELRTREHLTLDEVERLIEAAKSNRHGHRDALMVLLAYGMACERRKSSTYAGSRSTSKRRSLACGESRRAPRAATP
jgi:hypothetical protein